MISDKARHYAVRAQQIKIEVTERGFIDVPKTTPVIQAFRQAGYEVAIDDFGTGYSNLHNLYSLNVDILKIDKSFIDTLTTNSTSHLIAEHIIEMAQSLRLKTIAEGVETAEQRRYTRDVLRYVAIIKIAQRIGIPLATIGEAFGVLPEGHTLSPKEWKELSSQWREELDRRIHTLVALRDELDGCIGCGCLSRSDCPLRNPGDRLGEQGTGARLLEED
ncbi:hypothetical protein ID866_1939 [Astraeus odoratus]|nr:hypothetical protein ID866_1939 [Astraeus odoratus]